jgi:outer membrane protein OmpA-like peptidoglycan-associated protein
MFNRRISSAIASSMLIASCALALSIPAAQAEPVDTEMPGVSAELVDLRQNEGLLRMAVRLANATDKNVRGNAIAATDLVLVDNKSRTKYFPLQDPDKHYFMGPISDWNDGGRWWVDVPEHGQAIIWALYEPVAPGTVLSVQIPGMFPFDDIPVANGAGTLTSATQAVSTPNGFRLALVSAKRADQLLQLRLKLSADQKVGYAPTIQYRDVYFLDPLAKRIYPVMKDTAGMYLAQPIGDSNDGGRYFLASLRPGGVALMSLTLQAPPDTVTSGDLLVPGFLPLEDFQIAGTGGAQQAGLAAAGSSLGLEGALKELKAEVTPKEIKINLAADVLFDFDKSALKSAAETTLNNLLTVLKANPGAAVTVVGFTDAKGTDAHNLPLSRQRAEAVKSWLVAHGVTADTIATRGLGAANPVAPNTNPDGSDNPEGRQKNRRVEITVTRG